MAWHDIMRTMKILIFGATGMVGQGVLRECLEARDIERVVAVGRTPTRITHERLAEVVAPDMFALSALQGSSRRSMHASFASVSLPWG
jgi:nucleoside-diphosphate-sugar epimerase